MPEIDPLILQLRADLSRYQADLTRATRTVQTQLGAQETAIIDLERQINRSSGAMGRALLGAAATIAAAFSVDKIAEFADAYTRFTNSLKVAGVSSTQLAGTQNTLFGIAQKYGVELETLGGLYGRLKQGAAELGATSSDLTKFTTGVAAALKVQGGAASESKGALLQLSQALGSPIVRAEEFNSVNEGARPILQAVANGIDKYAGSVAKLRADVIEGKVASADFFQGFLRGSKDLEAQAAKANFTIGASFTVLNNALGKYIGETDQSISATARVSAGIAALANNLDVVAGALAVLGVSFGVRTFAAPLLAGVAASNLFIQSLNQERFVMLGSAVATAQKARAVAASAATEVAAIESTIVARRAEAAVLVQTAAREAALAAERRAAAILAANSNITSAAGRTAALAAQRKAENDATFATARLAAARQRLAVVDGELAVAEGALAGAQARSATAAAAAAAATSAATLSARAGVAVTKLLTGALTLLGGSTVGGLVVLTLGAIVGAILYYNAQARQAAEETAAFTANGEKLAETLVETNQYGRRAADAVGLVGTQAAGATGKVRAFAGAVGEAADALIRLAQSRRKESIESLRARETEANSDAAAAAARFQSTQQTGSSISRFGNLPQSRADEQAAAAAQKRFVEANQRREAAAAERRRLEGLPLIAFTTGSERENGRDVEGDLKRVTNDLVIARRRGITAQIQTLEAQKYELTQYKKYRKEGLSPQAASDASSKDRQAFAGADAGKNADAAAKKSGAKSKSDAAKAARAEAAAAKDALADDRAYAAQVRQSENDIASAKADLANSAEQRAQIEKDRIEADRIARNEDIADQAKQGRYGSGPAANARVLELQRLNDERAEFEKQVVDAKEKQRQRDAAAEVASAQHDAEISALHDQEEVAVTSAERRKIALAILDAETKYKEQVLQAIIDNTQIEKSRRDAAKIELDALKAGSAAARDRVNRDTESPLARYKREAAEVGNNINDSLETVAVDGLESLTDGITDAITGAKSLGDAFKQVANQIIADLIRIAVRKAIVAAIGAATGGGGGFPGFADGTSYAPGGMALVGERGPELVNLPRGSKVIPNHMIGAAASNARAAASMAGARAAPRGGGQTVIKQTFVLDARGGITTPELLQHVNETARREAATAGAASYKQALRDAPGAVNREQRFRG